MEGADKKGAGLAGFAAQAFAHHCRGIDVQVQKSRSGLDGREQFGLRLCHLGSIGKAICCNKGLVNT